MYCWPSLLPSSPSPSLLLPWLPSCLFMPGGIRGCPHCEFQPFRAGADGQFLIIKVMFGVRKVLSLLDRNFMELFCRNTWLHQAFISRGFPVSCWSCAVWRVSRNWVDTHCSGDIEFSSECHMAFDSGMLFPRLKVFIFWGLKLLVPLLASSTCLP